MLTTLRFANDWGSQTALWSAGGEVGFDEVAFITQELRARITAQAAVFEEHYSPDSGKWSAEDVRERHIKDCFEIASRLAAVLPSGVSLEHVPWEHGEKPYVPIAN